MRKKIATMTCAAGLLPLLQALCAGQAAAQPTPPAPSAPAIGAGARITLLDALRTTLQRQPSIAAARAQLSQRAAEAEAARGLFDGRFTSRLSHVHDVAPVLPLQRSPAGERGIITDTTDLSVGASQVTMIGTTISPSVGLTRLHSRVQDADRLGLPNQPVQQAHVGLSVVQPLLRGAGTTGAASAVTAGRLYRDAAGFSVKQTAQERVFDAAAAYFQLVAANDQLRWLEATAAGAQKLVDETQVLVASDQRPRSDLRQLEANLANRRRAVVEAENARIQAVYELGLAIGLGVDQIQDFRPADGFPKTRLPGDREALIRRAQRSRNDVQAARTSLAGAEAALRGAEHNTAPALDLGASVGYAGALERDGLGPYFAATGRNVRGVNAGVSLSLELPFANTQALAERDLRRAQYDSARIAASDLERTLPVAVARASEDLRLSTQALASASQAVAEYEQVVADQRDKVRAGVGTVIDMVLTEELLLTARQNQTANQLRCAVAQVRLLFESGALPSAEADLAPVLAELELQGAEHGSQ